MRCSLLAIELITLAIAEFEGQKVEGRLTKSKGVKGRVDMYNQSRLLMTSRLLMKSSF